MDPTNPCPVAHELSIAALRMECGALDSLVDRLRIADVGRPTRSPEWNLQQLLAHLVRGVDRIRAYLAAPVPPAAEVSWLDYWRHTREAADPAAVARRAREFAAEVNDRPIREVWRDTWRRSVDEAAACEPDRLLKPPFGPMRLDHYLTTRVLEVTIHGLDLRAALDLEEVATPLGREVTSAVLDGLLDGDRPDGLQGIGYLLAATGRRTHSDPRFPVLT